jgi:ankyrin repeat protein
MQSSSPGTVPPKLSQENLNQQFIDSFVLSNKNHNIYGAHTAQLSTVNNLIQAGANVNIRTTYDLTPLHLATLLNAVDSKVIVDILLVAGAEVNAMDSKLRTPLHTALMHSNQTKGAAKSNFVSLLLTAKADVRAPDISGDTPLHYICAQELETGEPKYNLEIAAKLIEMGADVSARNKDGMTPGDVAFGPMKEFLSERTPVIARPRNP